MGIGFVCVVVQEVNQPVLDQDALIAESGVIFLNQGKMYVRNVSMYFTRYSGSVLSCGAILSYS